MTTTAAVTAELSRTLAATVAAVEAWQPAGFVVVGLADSALTLGKRADGTTAFEFKPTPTAYDEAKAMRLARRWNLATNAVDVAVRAVPAGDWKAARLADLANLAASMEG